MNYGTDEYWMRIAYEEAKYSPDPSTQNGAIIVDPRPQPSLIGVGCNDFPEGVLHPDERLERPMKYHFVEHAERAAIFDAAIDDLSVYRSTMYALWAACSDCARAIIASGITELVTHSAYNIYEGPWTESIEYGNTMLDEAGVIRRSIDTPIMSRGEYLLFQGEKLRF